MRNVNPELGDPYHIILGRTKWKQSKLVHEYIHYIAHIDHQRCFSTFCCTQIDHQLCLIVNVFLWLQDRLNTDWSPAVLACQRFTVTTGSTERKLIINFAVFAFQGFTVTTGSTEHQLITSCVCFLTFYCDYRINWTQTNHQRCLLVNVLLWLQDHWTQTNHQWCLLLNVLLLQCSGNSELFSRCWYWLFKQKKSIQNTVAPAYEARSRCKDAVIVVYTDTCCQYRIFKVPLHLYLKPKWRQHTMPDLCSEAVIVAYTYTCCQYRVLKFRCTCISNQNSASKWSEVALRS